MVRVNVELDLPPGVELLGYERSGDGHGFEVREERGTGALL
jgi:hypothetical protein